MLAALAVSGLPSDRFLFAGFAPSKSQARATFLDELAPIRATLILYETGPRLHESLEAMLTAFGDRPAVVARELTKLHETVVRGGLKQLAQHFSGAPPKGEIVVLVGQGDDAPATPEDADTALREALTRLSPAEASAEVAKALGLKRRDLYQRALAFKAEAKD